MAPLVDVRRIGEQLDQASVCPAGLSGPPHDDMEAGKRTEDFGGGGRVAFGLAEEANGLRAFAFGAQAERAPVEKVACRAGVEELRLVCGLHGLFERIELPGRKLRVCKEFRRPAAPRFELLEP